MKNKYNIGDTVFYIEDRKVKEDVVTCIFVVEKEKSEIFEAVPDIRYLFGYSYIRDFSISEKDLFPSKEELLASL